MTNYTDRRVFLKTFSFATAGWAGFLPASLHAAPSGSRSKKKGYCGGNTQGHKQIKPVWYYTWSRSGKGSTKELEFVPMIKGRINLTPKTFQTIRGQKNIKHLLGYNEPERKKQGNISVADGLKHWPKLEKLAKEKNLRLGSPAVSSDALGLKWLADFMKGAKRRKFKVDFLAIHWYGGTNIKEFEKYLDRMYKTYRLPMWLTEFNGWSGTHKEMDKFALAAFKILEKHRRVERYSYFSKKKGEPGSMWNKDGSLSKIGLALQAL
ncbi:MAG: glycosyl hydrolase [Akkermansiaceae bacterium]